MVPSLAQTTEPKGQHLARWFRRADAERPHSLVGLCIRLPARCPRRRATWLPPLWLLHRVRRNLLCLCAFMHGCMDFMFSCMYASIRVFVSAKPYRPSDVKQCVREGFAMSWRKLLRSRLGACKTYNLQATMLSLRRLTASRPFSHHASAHPEPAVDGCKGVGA